MAQEVFSEYSPIDSTWTRTAAALAVSPGRILTAYQRGASRLYVTPLKLFIGAIALFLILLGAFDLSLYQFVWKAERGQPQVAQIDRAGEVHIRGTWQDDRWLQQRLSPSIDPSVERALGSGPIKGIPKTVAI